MLGKIISAIPLAARHGTLTRTVASVLATVFLAAASEESRAEEPSGAAVPLQELLRAGGGKPTRFVLTSGKTLVGRIVRIEENGLLIRRPSAGLLSLPLDEIAGVKVTAPDGGFLLGRVLRTADGSIGWVAGDAAPPARDVAAVDTDRPDVDDDGLTDSGGPFIRLDDTAVAPTEPETVADARSTTQPLAPAAAEDQQIAVVAPDATLAPGAGNPEGGSEPVRLTVTADAAPENDRLAAFRLTLSEPAASSILIIYTTIDDTAVAPGDYTHSQGVVVFEPGETEATVTTPIVDDAVAEGSERFALFVTGDPATVTIDERKVAATIDDDDG